MPRAGRLRRRVELQAPTPTQDATGQSVEAFTTVATVWAAIEVQRSQGTQEFFESDKITSEITHRIIIRHRTDVTALYRVKQGTRTWRILQVQNPKDSLRELILVSKELPSGEPV